MIRNFGFEEEREQLLLFDSSTAKVKPGELGSHEFPPGLEELGLVGLTEYPTDEPHAQGPSTPDCVASSDRVAQGFQGPRPHAMIIFYLLSP